MKNKVLILCIAFSFAFISDKATKIKPVHWVSLKIHEPSDVCLSADGNHLYIVDDSGKLFETDLEGKVTREAQTTSGDDDFEAVCTDGNLIYVCSETARKICVFDAKSLKRTRTVSLTYNGARNAGYESITFNRDKNSFILCTEKNPVYIREFNTNFQLLNEIELKGVRDISSATWHKGSLWLLSDEDMTVMKLDTTYSLIESSWKIPVINPEGFCFTLKDSMLISSDDMERLYTFSEPQK